MVAAGLGLPHAASDRTTLPETASRSLNISNGVRFDSLALLQESVRRPNFNVDYWHQHAIRTVIRHLSFTLTPANQPTAEQVMPLEVQTTEPQSAAKPRYQTGLWLAQVQGIRAGPASLA
jgi:secretion monitor